MAKDKGDVIDVVAREVRDSEAPARANQVTEMIAEAPAETAAPVIVVASALALLDPVQKILDDLRVDIAAATFDINTTAGEKIARELRQRCIKVRTTAKDTYEQLNAPLLEVQRGWRAKKTAIEEAVSPLEKPLDDAIKAKEIAKEEERLRKVAAEEARIAALREKISAITKIPAAAVKMSAAELEQQLLDLQAIEITDAETSYGEFSDEASLLRNETITQLNDMLAVKRRDEAERVRLDNEAAELRAQQEKSTAEAALRKRIDAIKLRAFDAMGKSAKQIDEILASVRSLQPVAIEFGDLHGEACTAWDATLELLERAKQAQAQAEAQAADNKRIADEQAARQRQLDEEDRKRREAAEEEERKRVAALAPAPTPAPVIESTGPAATSDAPETSEQIDDAGDTLSMIMFASKDYLEAARAAATPGPWLRTDNVIYRIANDENFDEITIGAAGGSREILARCALAQTIHEQLLRAGVQCEEIPS